MVNKLGILSETPAKLGDSVHELSVEELRDFLRLNTS